ncbi:MAG TPA: hypothetical protein VNA19_13350 [Pyrinomonadaceae bacterium]|jgi:hypothetical protein|nr:hypothetical protein [Pyrinomonadaceae bacterium]
MHKRFGNKLLAALCLLLALAAAPVVTARAQTPPKQVRAIYLVPADKQFQEEYRAAIERAMRQLQAWYRTELNGSTFALHSPVVEVHVTSHTSDWYSNNPRSSFAGNFWENSLSDGFALTGGGFDDPNNRWLYFIDADPKCTQYMGGTHGVALLAANDLRGLTGGQNIPPCAGDRPDNGGKCRWVGGLGHELGHAFDLPHPPTCEDNNPATSCPSSTLMYLGYASFPNTFLLDSDKTKLLASPFFSQLDIPLPAPDCSSTTDTTFAILTEANTQRAVAVNTVTFVRDPFPVTSPHNLSADERTRITIFARNANFQPGDLFTAQAEDAQQRIYPLTIEYVGKVPNQDWLTQIVLLLPAELRDAGDVRLSITLRGTPSNKALITIKP